MTVYARPMPYLGFDPAGSVSEIRGLSYTLTGLGVLADVGTVISPQNKGVLDGVDRGAAIVNGVLLTLNATTDWVPGAVGLTGVMQDLMAGQVR